MGMIKKGLPSEIFFSACFLSHPLVCETNNTDVTFDSGLFRSSYQGYVNSSDSFLHNTSKMWFLIPYQQIWSFF